MSYHGFKAEKARMGGGIFPEKKLPSLPFDKKPILRRL